MGLVEKLKTRLLIIITIYGIIVTSFSTWQWPNEGIHLILNLPGNLLGEFTYQKSIEFLGDPSSAQAHFTIPWILRIPQVFVPISISFWIGFGLAVQISYERIKSKNFLDSN